MTDQMTHAEAISLLVEKNDETEKLRAENEALQKDAERFNYLQNIPIVEAQAFFWRYLSTKRRARAIDAARKGRL